MNKKMLIRNILIVLLFLCIFVNVAGLQLKEKYSSINNQNHLSLTSLESSSMLWSKTFGGKGSDICWSLSKTQDRGYIIIGETTSFDYKGGDAWLIKLDAEGNEEWNHTYGGSRGDYGLDGVETKDGGYVLVGGTKTYNVGDHDTWLIKTDVFGNEIWNKSYGGVNRDQGYRVIQVADGGFVICGGSGSFSEGPNDYWIIKIDAEGNEIWNITYGGLGADWGYDVIEGINNELYFTGGTDTSLDHTHILDIGLVQLDKNGQIIWEKTFNKPPEKQRWDEGYSVIKTNDKGFLIAGIAHTYHWGEDGQGDGWIIKTDEKGDMIWNRIFGGDLCDGLSTVKQTLDGGYVLAGWTYSYGGGDADIWLLKIDSMGYVEWDITLGGEEWEWSMLHTLELTDDDCFLIAGTTNSFGAGGSDVYLAKIKKPALDISFQDGFGFSFQVNNNGDVDFTDLDWTINISNVVLFGNSFEGSIDSLPTGGVITIDHQGLMIGFGSGCVRMAIGNIGKTIHCLFIGPLVLKM